MTKKNVLRKNWEFKTIIEKGRQISSKFLVIYYDKNSDDLKIGISIPKKFVNAFWRNRYRNQVRNILREIIKETEILEKKYKMVIILRKPFLILKFPEKKNQLIKILQKI